MFYFQLLLILLTLSLACGSDLRGFTHEHSEGVALEDEPDDAVALEDERDYAFALDSSDFDFQDSTDTVAVDELVAGEETSVADRSLLIQYPVQCKGPIVPFDLKFYLQAQGGWDTSGCTTWRKTKLGQAINKLLLDYGIGKAGRGDNVKFHAEVCTTPKTLNRRRLGKCNCSFLYGGAMNCGYCGDDNKDRRALEGDYSDSGRLLAEGDPNWFVNIYAPSMENALRNTFVNDIQKSHKQCLGNGPMVDIQITKRNTIKKTVC